MAKSGKTISRRKEIFVGSGGIVSTVLNKAIDLLPFELHLPGGYQYCGPGTKLAKRLARGDKGINPLDEACKLHDIAYSKNSDSESRKKADGELAARAWQRFKAFDSSVGERTASLAVAAAMKAKTALGGGKRRKRPSKRKTTRGQSSRGGGLYLKPYKGSGGRKRKTITKRKKKLRRYR